MNLVDISPESEEIRQEALAACAAADEAREKRDAMDRRLAPFSDNLPYDRERVIQYGKFQLEQAFISMYEVGKCLLLLFEHESWHTYANILEEHFGGMAPRTSRQYMRFARFAGQFPRFRTIFERPKMAYKGFALLEGLEDPEVEETLQEFEDTGKWGDLEEDEIVAKSVRELKRENQRLRAEKDKAVATALEKIEKENQELQEKVEALEASANPDFAAVDTLVRQAEKKILDATALLRRIPAEIMQTDKVLQNVLLGIVGKVVRVIRGLEDDVLAAGGGVADE